MIDVLFNRFDATLRNAGYLPMYGQILAATLVAAPKQRNTNEEKADLREGRIPQDWQDKPSKLSHKDRHARWTLKFTKAKRQDDGTIPSTDLAIPFFGYKSHVSIDRKFRLIRKWKTTDAAASDGARLREGLLDRSNTASDVWADTASTAQKPMRPSWKSMALSRRFTGKSHISSRCHGISKNRMQENPLSGRVSSMSLPIRNRRQDCSYEPLA
ncbi:transposase [Acetobacter pasteurianus 386B]|nr:transposase [Acetobacter pasteurianus 386B]CCT58820.1 transposase [Acetobacter pasteurianus 386B]